MIYLHVLSGNLSISNLIEDHIDKLSKNNGLTGDIAVFGGGDEYLRRAEIELADILFLDADSDLGSMSGIETAEEFRKRNPHAKIVLLTGNKELIADALHVRPFAWIGKPICENEFNRVFLNARKVIHSEHDKFWYRSNKEEFSVPISTLIYIESKGHDVNLYLENGEMIRFRDKLSNVYAKLSGMDFIQISKSYVIHLKKVVYRSKSEFVMKNGAAIKVSRSFREKADENFRIFRQLESHR